MKEIRFRQAIFKDGKFHHWHSWGFCGHRGDFVSPIRIKSMGDSIEPTGYEVKDSQQYTGLRCGPVSTDKEIYEGDILTHNEIKDKYLPYIVKFGEHTDIAEAGCTQHTNLGFFVEEATGGQVGLLNEELLIDWAGFEVIGNVWENPELLKGD